jgi:CRP-like cAMP-binding protein
MGSGLDLLARRKDGSEFPVDVMLSPVNAPTGLLVLAVVRDISERLSAVEAQVSLIAQLQSALAEVRTLRGLLPICSYCKQIRVDTGSWQQIEVYLKAHTEAEFSHGICPPCAEKQLAEFRKRKAAD